MRWLAAVVWFAIAVGALSAQTLPPALQAPAPPTSAAEPKAEREQLAKALRTLLLANLPDPLVEAPAGWGTQREVAVGIDWKRNGLLRVRPEAAKAVRNDGHWQRLTITAADPAKTLTVKVSNVRSDADKTAFDVAVGLDVRLLYEQQVWTFGRRVYAGETRATCRADVRLAVEVTRSVSFKPGALLPDVTLRAKVASADVRYRDLECEHTLGVGGDAAKLVGKAVEAVVKKVKPDLEKDLLAKANAGIVKAADTKDVKIEFASLFSGQSVAKKAADKK